jgi:hypothetical protein
MSDCQLLKITLLSGRSYFVSNVPEAQRIANLRGVLQRLYGEKRYI